jgi:hypothetical protein
MNALLLSGRSMPSGTRINVVLPASFRGLSDMASVVVPGQIHLAPLGYAKLTVKEPPLEMASGQNGETPHEQAG